MVKQFRLFLDSDGYIRCGGRIHNAPVAELAKFPYLLPGKHHLTRLIIQDTHERPLYAGISATVTQLRQKYWIVSIRQNTKIVLRKCVTCRKVIGKPHTIPDPPPLPTYRLQDSDPFTVTGVNFTGALYVRDHAGKETSVYICLFPCTSTTAIHLELVLFDFINLTQVHNLTVSAQDIFTFHRLSVFTVSFIGILQVLMR